jgi:PPP family 3-phenylpropionic acid transporter
MRSVLGLSHRIRRALALRFSVFYWVLFLQIGIGLPFWPLVLSAGGLSPAQIGLVAGAAPAARLIAGPLLGFAFDRYRLGRGAILIVALVAAAGLGSIGLAHGFLPMLLLTLLFAPLYPSLAPLVDAHAIRTAEAHGLDFGRMRLWGSIGFIVANLCGGMLIRHADTGMILGLVVATTALAGLAAPILPPFDEPRADTRPDWTMAGALLRLPAFVTAALIAGGIQASHALLYGFGSLGWRAQGLDETAIGLLWATGVLAEVVFLSQSRRLQRQLGPEGFLVLGGLAGVLRWGAMTLTPPLPLLFVLQLLHGFTFAATYLGGILLVQKATPAALAATGQALYAAIGSGILFASATAVSGALFGAFGSGAYVAPAGLAAACALAALALVRRRSKPPPKMVSPTISGTAEP